MKANIRIINMKDNRDNVVKLFLSFLFSLIYILIVAILTDNLNLQLNNSLFASIYAGGFEMGITFIIWLKVPV